MLMLIDIPNIKLKDEKVKETQIQYLLDKKPLQLDSTNLNDLY